MTSGSTAARRPTSTSRSPRGARTGCRRGADTFRNTRSGSSSPTSARWPTSSRRTPLLCVPRRCRRRRRRSDVIQNALHPAGIQASRIGSLWNGYMVVMVTVYVIVILWMLAAVWRAHKNAAPQISEKEERPHAITVGVAAALTTVTLIGLLIASVATGSAVGTYGDKRSD